MVPNTIYKRLLRSQSICFFAQLLTNTALPPYTKLGVKQPKTLLYYILLEYYQTHPKKHVVSHKTTPVAGVDWEAKYKGAMTRQLLTDIDNQLNELRTEWE